MDRDKEKSRRQYNQYKRDSGNLQELLASVPRSSKRRLLSQLEKNCPGTSLHSTSASSSLSTSVLEGDNSGSDNGMQDDEKTDDTDEVFVIGDDQDTHSLLEGGNIGSDNGMQDDEKTEDTDEVLVIDDDQDTQRVMAEPLMSWKDGIHHRINEYENISENDDSDDDMTALVDDVFLDALEDFDESLHSDDEQNTCLGSDGENEQPTGGNVNDCDEEPENTQENSPPLYNGATITVMESLLLTLVFAMKHQLTGVALVDLLTLISLHCLAPNLCKTSLYLFNKFFGNLQSAIVFHKFCAKCFFLFEGDPPACCSICSSDLSIKNSISYFIEIPVLQQLQDMFMRPNFYNDLQYRFRRTKQNKDNIEDIYDGKLYQDFMKNGGPLSSPDNISMMWYTDGIPLFKSSSASLWPLYFTINELPYKKRVLKENTIIAGLWFGETKPCMSTFLKPFHDTFETLAEGFDITLPDNTKKTVRSIILGGTCDMPAKSIVLNMIQFNGRFGCSRCLQKGETVPSGRGHTHAYPYKEDDPTGPPRTYENFVNNAEQAYDERQRVNGVNGPSWMLYLYDVVRGTAIDYMHGVLLGVTRKMIYFWVDSSYHQQPFSLTKSIKQLNSRLLSIKPPTYVSRAPASLGKLKFWKASEFRNWLFYYSVPVLFGILPDIYFQHHILLVTAIYTLNSQSISHNDIDQCELILRHYCSLCAILYGDNVMGINVHSLVHLADNVRDLGPLYTFSCFPFESLNGDLKSLFHGTQEIEKQMAHAISKIVKLPVLASRISHNSKVYTFFQKLRGISVQKGIEISGGNGLVLGSMRYKTLNVAELQAAQRDIEDDFNNRVLSFLRVQKEQHMFSSVLYTRQFVRNSSVVKIIINETVNFAEVQFFFKYPTKCVCVDPAQCTCAHYYAMVKVFEEVTDWSLSNDDVTNASLTHIAICKSLLDRSPLSVIPLSTIKCVCILMAFKDQEDVFIAQAPNLLESD